MKGLQFFVMITSFFFETGMGWSEIPTRWATASCKWGYNSYKWLFEMGNCGYIWLQVKMRGPDQPSKPTGDPDPRSRPAIQTDPDLTIQTDPDLTIQTYDQDPFVLCWLEIFFFKVLKSITLYYKVLLQYYFVLQSTTLYYKVRCWVIS